MVLGILVWVVIIRVIISWIPHDPNQAFFRYLHSVTDPLLKPFRFARAGMIDLSPIILLLVIQVLRALLHNVRF